MNVVIVESPAKAKTINKYLGKDYRVLASFGHVRDLPPKDGSVRPDEDFAMSWELHQDAAKRVKEIAAALQGADALYLATDPDREGEAISWHLLEELKRRRALKDKRIERVVFHEITASAVKAAFSHPRAIDEDLVQAYLARRALDYLVGFSLSPLLWRKLPGARSAGRVQSVALRLIAEREAEIEVFKPQEYWDISGQFVAQAQGEPGFTAKLSQLDGKKLAARAINNEAEAIAIRGRLEAATGWRVTELETKAVKRHPAPPFITSTLQQEASRKLGFSNAHTMRVAQRLYEGIAIGGETVGLITYMRTDGLNLSSESVAAARALIKAEQGEAYLPDKPRFFKSRAKNAQEAHEAIRPTDPALTPSKVRAALDSDQLKLYSLIWKRMLASQMTPAQFEQVGLNVAPEGDFATLRATGSTLLFDGFLALYQEGQDDREEDEAKRLPRLTVGQALKGDAFEASQHFTQPPPRYSEASLVKAMETLGIGRPSTYASIIQVLQDRDYVQLEKKRFVPADRGRMVTAFLVNFFGEYVDYDFTAALEAQLDEVSGGRQAWKDLLAAFWKDFHSAVDEAMELRLSAVIDRLDEALGPHFFPALNGDADAARRCPACTGGRLGLKLARTGGFIGCSNYPECRYTRALAVSDADAMAQTDRMLGQDSESGMEVFLKKGPYGWYVQLGKEAKPKRTTLPKTLSYDEVTLEIALKLLALPRLLGATEAGEIEAGLGRYGAFVRRGKVYASLGKDDDVLSIGMNRAVTLLAEKESRKGGDRFSGTPLGAHPKDGTPVTLHEGRYGAYVKHGKQNASLPKDVAKGTLTLDLALEILAAKASSKAGQKTGVKKPPAKRTATKKTATKKAGAKKTGTTRRATAGKSAAAS
jgi:DNA topoisomerase-1